jgi:hypothetical protein
MKNIVLLLTGTVNSSGVHFMLRNNTEERLSDYMTALNKWFRTHIIKIVFVENSNFPKESLETEIISNENFEYLTFNGQDFTRSKGKGFGEINSFEYAFTNSRLLKEADFIIKCNGRYFFKGYSKFWNIDADVIGNFSKDLCFMDSRVFGFSKSFFCDYLVKYKTQIDDSKGVFFEHALAMATHEVLSKNGKWHPIPFPLIIDGFSGTDNLKYNTLGNIFKIYLKYYLSKLIK